MRVFVEVELPACVSMECGLRAKNRGLNLMEEAELEQELGVGLVKSSEGAENLPAIQDGNAGYGKRPLRSWPSWRKIYVRK